MDKRHRFDSWVKKISWRREWQPAPIFLAGESHGQRSLENYSPWGLKESDLAEATYHTHTHMGILLPSWTLFLSYLLLLDEFLPFWTTDSFDSVKSVGFFSEWFFFFTHVHNPLCICQQQCHESCKHLRFLRWQDLENCLSSCALLPTVTFITKVSTMFQLEVNENKDSFTHLIPLYHP